MLPDNRVKENPAESRAILSRVLLFRRLPTAAVHFPSRLLLRSGGPAAALDEAHGLDNPIRFADSAETLARHLQNHSATKTKLGCFRRPVPMLFPRLVHGRVMRSTSRELDDSLILSL
jgi:hypothetical protein